jgi:hypothetical protein
MAAVNQQPGPQPRARIPALPLLLLLAALAATAQARSTPENRAGEKSARNAEPLLSPMQEMPEKHWGKALLSQYDTSGDSFAPKTGASFGKALSNDYRATFFAANPELEGQVVVHHAVEQQVLTKFPGVVTEAEIHSLENLRGIPKAINSDVHLSQIRVEWNRFYKPFIESGTSPTKAQLLEKAAEIDAKFGSKFTPPVGGGP